MTAGSRAPAAHGRMSLAAQAILGFEYRAAGVPLRYAVRRGDGSRKHAFASRDPTWWQGR